MVRALHFSDSGCVLCKRAATHARTAPDAEGEVRLAKEGIAARTPVTVMQQFYAACKAHGPDVALRVERDGCVVLF